MRPSGPHTVFTLFEISFMQQDHPNHFFVYGFENLETNFSTNAMCISFFLMNVFSYQLFKTSVAEIPSTL